MAIFKYTLPSGATFQMTAPDGTTQAAADKIFYEQVAAGTFVGYKTGDTLSHPEQALINFGLTRLERGTAGVSDNAVLAINSGLPVTQKAYTYGATGSLDANTLAAITATLPTVAPLPDLSQVPIQNGVSQTDVIQVISNPIDGVFAQRPTAIGGLTSIQKQAIMAQVSNSTGQGANVITQKYGVGKYGFNSIQLERAGYIKPGYSQRYCRINSNTQANPDNFVAFMKSPSPWVGGITGVNSVDDILNNEALQNQIQEELMDQSLQAFEAVGLIKLKNNTPTTSPQVLVFTSSGMTSGNTVSILNNK